MTIPAPYSEHSPEFAEMLRQAELCQDGGKAAFAAAQCYRYGSSIFCKIWYETYVMTVTSDHIDLETIDLTRPENTD